MPVTLHRIQTMESATITAIGRVLKDVPTDHSVWSLLKKINESNVSDRLYLAHFNDRVVGLALLENGFISAFQVHPATRRRGVGTRMMSLLNEQESNLAVAPLLRFTVIDTLLQSARSCSSTADS